MSETEEITIDDFLKVDIRVGEVLEVNEFPEARKPAWKLRIDFGEKIGIKKCSAQVVANYSKEDLLGKQVMAVVNFPPRQIGPFMSEVLTLGFLDADGNVVLASADRSVPIGGRLH
ncbi:MAG: tRNA-binding protein [Rhizobiaceae bacterium]